MLRRRLAVWTEVLLLVGLVAMAYGAAQAQSPDVLNERIVALRETGVAQDARLLRLENRQLSMDDRLFYLLLGVATQLVATASMIAMNFLKKTGGDA